MTHVVGPERHPQSFLTHCHPPRQTSVAIEPTLQLIQLQCQAASVIFNTGVAKCPFLEMLNITETAISLGNCIPNGWVM